MVIRNQVNGRTEYLKSEGQVFDSMYNKHHAHRGTAPVLTDLSNLHPHARV